MNLKRSVLVYYFGMFAVLGGTIGANYFPRKSGIEEEISKQTIQNIQLRYINNDSLQDIVDPVHKRIYLQQKDGKFIEFNEYSKNRIDSLVKYEQENANKTIDSLKNIYFGNKK